MGLFLGINTLAQNPYNGKHYDHWAFGNGVEMDFSSGAAVMVGCTLSMFASEGCAAYSDPATGNFIAYTNGQSVWQAGTNVTLANGTGLIGNSSSIESGMILPKPGGTPGQFYVFHNNTTQAYYSEVDMAVGPNGTVITANVLLSNTSAERFGTVPHANGMDYWVLCNQGMNGTILAFLVSSAGVSATPVASPTGIVGGAARGNFTLTSDFATIGMSVEQRGMYLFDFDNCTGVASNPLKIGTTTNGFGSCFSQDDTKLYYTNGYSQPLYQYDMLTGVETLIGTGAWSYPVLAPDGLVYVSAYGAANLGVVNAPNAAGAACNFVAAGFNLGGCTCTWGLPKPFYLASVFIPPTTPDTVNICTGDTAILVADPGTGYLWNTGDTTNSISTTNPGTYTVQIQHGTCSMTEDTMVVNLDVLSNIAISATICSGDSFAFGGTYYSVSGVYNDTLPSSGLGCDTISELTLTVAPASQSTANVSICDGDSIFLANAFQTAAGVYDDSLQTASGCDSIIQTTLTILASPTSTNSISICSGDSVFLENAFQSTAGVYNDTLVGAAANGCDSIIETTLSILPVPSSSQNVNICQGDNIVINGTPVSTAGSYNTILTSANGCDSIFTVVLTVSPIINTNQSLELCVGDSIFLANAFQTSSGVYVDTLQTNMGCDSTLTTVLTVLPVPVSTITPQADLCFNNGSVSLSAVDGGGTWSGNGITNVNSGTFNPTSAGVGTHTITYAIAGTCGNSSTATINVLSLPQITGTVVDDSCSNNLGAVGISISGAAPFDILWETGLTTPNIIELGFGDYIVNVTDNLGCENTASFSVADIGEVCSSFYIPNAFTPDGDGLNDEFLPLFSGVDINTVNLFIFDRWGELIFQSAKTGQGWDGTYKGKKAPLGVYVYLVKYKTLDQLDAVDFEARGKVSLMR